MQIKREVDDTFLLYSEADRLTIENIINQDLAIYDGWLQRNKLVMNTGKTKFMLFKQKNKENLNINIHVDGKFLERTCEMKYLGLLLDDGLTWLPHINDLRRKLAPLIGLLHRYRMFPTNLKHLIINAFVLSKLHYGILSWSQASDTKIKTISKLLTKAYKTLYQLPMTTPSEEVYGKAKALNVYQIIILEKCKLIYKIQSSAGDMPSILCKVSETNNYNSPINT